MRSIPEYDREVADDQRINAAEVIAALSLATDLGLQVDLEHGLRSTLFAMRLAERLDADLETQRQTYYVSLLQNVGCTADLHVRAGILGDVATTMRNYLPVWFGSQGQIARAIARSVAADRAPPVRVVEIARTMPRAIREMPRIDVACREVARMLIERLGLPASIGGLFAQVDERWDGSGDPGTLKGDAISLPMRIAHVARDIDIQRSIGGAQLAAEVVEARAGSAFDPAIAKRFADDSPEILALDEERSTWDEVVELEPGPKVVLVGDDVDRALSAIGEFTDLISPFLSGHSAGVADLAARAGARLGLDETGQTAVRRAGLVHDVGRVAIPVGIWQKPGPLSPGEWEKVRLHAYHSERVLKHSQLLSELSGIASVHHERLDGSGYHRGLAGSGLSPPARLLAAADAYHAMTEPRPHRPRMRPEQAAEQLELEAKAGALDPDATAAVLESAGHRAGPVERPAGLTDREAEVLALLARGLQTKQVAFQLGISVKTADRHIQNLYRRIGVSTRAGATVFAMEHGMVGWGELPIAEGANRT